MSSLHRSSTGELCLTLRGEEENPILATLRHWPYWQNPRSTEQKIELQLLDSLALFLASQSCTTTYAAAIDRSNAPVTFVLATKGGSPTTEDRRDAERLFDTLVDARYYEDMRDFMMKYCPEALSRRKRKVSFFSNTILSEVLTTR